MDVSTRRKWDAQAPAYDLMNAFGPERRWAPWKRELFAAMSGKALFVGLGTGLDIQFFPPGRDIVAIDISAAMLARARPRAARYAGKIALVEMDVHDLGFREATFDQAFTSCTFCSVPDPVGGLKALRRVLKAGAELRMFEHTGSRYFPFSLLLRVMSPLAGKLGPELDRDTVANVRRAGFVVTEVKHVFLDVVKTIRAVAPA